MKWDRLYRTAPEFFSIITDENGLHRSICMRWVRNDDNSFKHLSFKLNFMIDPVYSSFYSEFKLFILNIVKSGVQPFKLSKLNTTSAHQNKVLSTFKLCIPKILNDNQTMLMKCIFNALNGIDPCFNRKILSKVNAKLYR